MGYAAPAPTCFPLMPVGLEQSLVWAFKLGIHFKNANKLQVGYAEVPFE